MRRLVLPAALIMLLTAGSLAFADVPKILKISEVKPGTAAVGFSVFRGVEPQRFDVELRGITDFGGFNLILSRISGGPMETPLEQIGAIQGMSGSPIYVGSCNDYKDCANQAVSAGSDVYLVGALSYSIGYFIIGGTNALLTPAEYMLGAELGGYTVTRQFSSRRTVNVNGTEFFNLMLFPGIDSKPIQVRSSGNVCGDSVKGELSAGSMVAVFLAQGSIDLAASGTVTWRDGNKIYIFGHPFLGTGIISYPFRHTSVADTLQTPVESRKIPGCYLETDGVMLADGTFEVVGVIGQPARILPFQVELHADSNAAVLDEKVAISPMTSGIIARLPIVWAQQFLGDTRSVSVLYQVRIPLAENPELFSKNLIPAQTVEDPLTEVFLRVLKMLENLKKSGFDYSLEGIRVRVDFVKDLSLWKVKRSFLSQNTAKPGDTVYVNMVFDKFEGGSLKQISIPVKVPSDFMDRVVSGVAPQVSVVVQSASKFTAKSSPKTIVSLDDLIKEINESANLKPNVLYVQQVMPLPKDKREAAEKNAKSPPSSAWSWIDLDQGGLRQLPDGSKEEITLNVSPGLDHFIEFDSTFNITVQTDQDAAKKNGGKDKTEQAKKKRKWFFLYLK